MVTSCHQINSAMLPTFLDQSGQMPSKPLTLDAMSAMIKM